MRINLNETVEFVLTEHGAEVWNQANPHCARMPGPASEQLWQVIEVFGPGMHHGSDNVFDGNTITAKDTYSATRDLLKEYVDAFARAQRTLLDAGNVIRSLRDGRAPGQSINALIDECILAAMNPGVVEHSKSESETEFSKSIELDGMPWSVGRGRLSVQLHALTDLLALARSLGAEVGTFTVHELATIARDLHAASYTEHSIALNKIHAMLHNMPATSEPMPAGSTGAIAETVERVGIMIEVLRKAADALVGGAA